MFSEIRPYCLDMTATAFPTELSTAWQQVLVNWNQPALHDTLLGLAAKHTQFAWLAARYKDASRTNPADPIATHRLARVQRAAAVVAFAMPRAADEPVKKPFRGIAMMLAGAVIATGLAMFLTNNKVQQHQQDSRSLVTRHP